MNDQQLLKSLAEEMDWAVECGATIKDVASGVDFHALTDMSGQRTGGWATGADRGTERQACWIDGFVIGRRYEQIRSQHDISQPARSS